MHDGICKDEPKGAPPIEAHFFEAGGDAHII